MQIVEIDNPYTTVKVEIGQELRTRLYEAERAVREAKQQPKPLSDRQWDALAACERRVFQSDRGCHGWTDVMMNDGDSFLNSLWSHTADYVQNEDFEGKGEAWQLHETARRVAQSLAIMAFGAEILING